MVALRHFETSVVINNRYLLLEAIGTGAMGTVYRAVDRLTGQTVALKRVNLLAQRDLSGHVDLRLLLAQEFRMLASMRHPNIISVLDYGFDENRQPYYTMELLENKQDVLSYTQQLPLGHKIAIFVQVLQALDYLHRRGVIHRDLKPANVQVIDKQVKVLDFGLAIMRDNSRTDEVVGTVPYLAPEVLYGEPATEASDLYAVGVMAYQAITGQHPFDGPTNADIINNTLYNEPDYTPLIGLDENVLSVIARLLARQPERRFQTAQEVITAIANLSGKRYVYETAATRESLLGAARFVGRDAELMELSDALTRAMKGEGSAWLVAGESGVGKTRLLEELRVVALVKGAMVLHGQNIREGGEPYTLWRDTLRRLTLRSEFTDEEASLLKLLLPDIDTLLDRPVPPAPDLPAQIIQEKLLRVIEDLFERQRQPIVLILEDLQWMRPESLAIMKHLNMLAPKLPLLIVGSYRSDETPRLSESIPAAQVIRLRRLDKDQIATLSASMIGTGSRHREIVEFLERETEGNIYFIIETVRALAEEAGELAEITNVDLPQRVFAKGVHRIVQRKLSRVPDSARPMLKIAAIAGRWLDLKLLRHINSDLERWLQMCSDATVLEFFNGNWQFTHDKLRDGVLAGLEDAERRFLHQLVAESMEQIYPSQPQMYLSLAYHWMESGSPEKALHYTICAGDHAFKLYAIQDAIHSYTQAAEQAFRVKIEDEVLSHLYSCLGRVLELDSQFSQALGAYEELLSLAKSRNDLHLELTALNAMAGVLCGANPLLDAERGRDVAYVALHLARKLGDVQAEAKTLCTLMMLSMYADHDPDIAQQYGIQSATLARESNLREQLAYTLNDLSRVYFTRGSFRDGGKALQEAGELWRDFENIPMLADNLSMTSIQSFFAGDFDNSLTVSEEAHRLSRSIGTVWGQSMSLMMPGIIQARRGNFARAIELMDECLFLSDQSGNASPLVSIRSELALVYGQLGMFDHALELVQQAKRLVNTDPVFYQVRLLPVAAEAWVHFFRGDRNRAQLILDQHEYPHFGFFLGSAPEIMAEVDFRLAFARMDYEYALYKSELFLETVMNVGVRSSVPKILRFKGAALRNLNRLDEAREAFALAKEEAESMGALYDLWQILFPYGLMEAEHGDWNAGNMLVEQARDIVLYIADNTGNLDRRESFLNLRDVRALLTR